MAQGGRRRRSEEQPNSEFGTVLKEHLRRIEGFTQVELARESLVAPETISRMVKGERVSGKAARGNVRAIIKALYHKKALLTLDEANTLIRTIPTNGALDERDAADREIIALFDPPMSEAEQVAQQLGNNAVATPDSRVSTENWDDMLEGIVEEDTTEEDIEEPTVVPLPTMPPPPIVEPTRIAGRETNRRLWWYIGSAVLALIVIVGLILTQPFSTRQTDACSASTSGVILYTNIHFQGQCHTFTPGDYELAQYGLEQNVSSIKDVHSAYFIKLFDKAKNFYNLDKDASVLPADWDKRADTIHIEKHRPTSCTPGSNGIIAFIDTDYSGGCLFITHDIPDLTPLNFDQILVSIQFVGTYQNTRQLVFYRQPDYKDECGAYWQDQSDLLQCARIALSVQVRPFTPPTPIPTILGTRYVGNVVPLASLSPGNAGAVVDGNLSTEWVGGHMAELDLHWAFPVTIHRVVIWDRKQSSTDNNQINKLKLSFSNGTSTGSIDMISQGPRCADVTLPEQTITWLRIIPVDASGTNGFREVEVWATTGPQYSNNTCVNKRMVAQTVPS